MITSPGAATVELTPWEARTRLGRPLVAPFLAVLPHEMQIRQAHNPTVTARMRFFKRAAPNNMKKEDLLVKSRIITDPVASPRSEHCSTRCLAAPEKRLSSGQIETRPNGSAPRCSPSEPICAIRPNLQRCPARDAQTSSDPVFS